MSATKKTQLATVETETVNGTVNGKPEGNGKPAGKSKGAGKSSGSNSGKRSGGKLKRAGKDGAPNGKPNGKPAGKKPTGKPVVLKDGQAVTASGKIVGEGALEAQQDAGARASATRGAPLGKPFEGISRTKLTHELGRRGMTVGQARELLKALGAVVNETSLNSQISHGKAGSHCGVKFEPVEFTTQQEKFFRRYMK